MKAEELMGRVVAGFGGFYHVRLSDGRVLVCRGRGKLKKTHKSILVGDDVRISMLDGEGVLLGNSDQKVEAMIEEIYPRRNQLHRPHICNIDQLVIVLAWHLPDYDLLLLDNMLLMARMAQVDVLICFNKTDLMLPEEQPQLELIRRAYGEAGCKVLTVSAELGRGVEELRHELSGRCSVFAGPSGVGKSSLLNLLLPDEHAQTGAVSERLLRGKHTTRYVRLLPLPDDEANGICCRNCTANMFSVPNLITVVVLTDAAMTKSPIVLYAKLWSRVCWTAVAISVIYAYCTKSKRERRNLNEAYCTFIFIC